MITMIFNTNNTPMFLLTAKKKKVTLEDCPIGLFMYKGELHVKTDYFSADRVYCFSVSDGNIFQIDLPVEEYMKLKVKPLKSMDLLKHAKKS